MNIGTDSVTSSSRIQTQAQVTVLKKSEELQKQNVMQLINSVSGVTASSRPSTANPPGVGQNLNLVA